MFKSMLQCVPSFSFPPSVHVTPDDPIRCNTNHYLNAISLKIEAYSITVGFQTNFIGFGTGAGPPFDWRIVFCLEPNS